MYIKSNEPVSAALAYSGEIHDNSLSGIGLVIEDQTGEIMNIIKEQKKFKVSLRPDDRQDPFVFDCVYRRHEEQGQTSLVGATFVATEYEFRNMASKHGGGNIQKHGLTVPTGKPTK